MRFSDTDKMRLFLVLCLAVPALCIRASQRITNGFDAAISDYPYTLSLRDFGAYECGAVLIANDRALTAAHCTGKSAVFYSIVGGSNDYTVDNCSTCVVREVDWINRHPEWDQNGAGYPNDIAVLGFTALVTNVNLEPVVMAMPTDGAFTGYDCTIIGWGAAKDGEGLSQILQFSTGTILPNVDCSNLWGITPINDGHICIKDSNSGICHGDAGGPMECPGGIGGAGILAGIASWGEASCDPTFPSVYARVGNYYNWIIQQ